jgi:hypothetical protein
MLNLNKQPAFEHSRFMLLGFFLGVTNAKWVEPHPWMLTALAAILAVWFSLTASQGFRKWRAMN